MYSDRPARRRLRVALEDVVSLSIGIIVLAIEGILISMGVLPPFWH
jgi:hypothetical protein